MAQPPLLAIWDITVLCRSNPRVPRVAVLCSFGSLALAPFGSSVRYGNCRKILQMLVTQLALHTQAHRRAVGYRKTAAVHSVGQQCLRMQNVSHIEAVPPSVDARKENVLRLRLNTHGIENNGKRNSSPLRNRGPALLADMLSNLRTGWKSSKVFERQLRWMRDQPVDTQSPLLKPAG